MKKYILSILVLTLILALAACGGTGETVSSGDTYTSTSLPSAYEDALSVRNQLALGIIRLDQTDLAPTVEQAQSLVTLWQALRSLQLSGNASEAETSALLAQIESTLTEQQLQAIAEMQLTFIDMQEWAAASGIQLGVNGGIPGQNQGQGQSMSPEARATKQAAAGISSDGSSGNKLSSALIDAVIAALEM